MHRKTFGLAALAVASLFLLVASTATAASEYTTTNDAVDNGDGTYTIDTSDGASYGSVERVPPAGTTVADLEGYLSFAFERTATCGGGSPRINIHFDDGTYLTTDGPGSPGYSGCPDLVGSFDATAATTAVWRLHPGPGYRTWENVVDNFGEREVVKLALVDDSFWSSDYQSVSIYSNVVLGPPSPTKDDCKKGGWQERGFKNQGQCVASIQANEKADK